MITNESAACSLLSIILSIKQAGNWIFFVKSLLYKFLFTIIINIIKSFRVRKGFLISQGSEEFCIMSSERDNESTCYLKIEQSINIISRLYHLPDII